MGNALARSPLVYPYEEGSRMALVQDGYRMVVTVYDTSGSPATLSYDMTSADDAAAATDAATILAALTAATKSTIGQYTYGPKFVEDALTLPADAENVIKASISAYIDGLGNKRANIKIPAPVNAMFTATSGPGFNVVSGSAAAVTGYLDLFETTGGVATISDGETLRDTQNFAGGKRISRASQNP